MKRFLIIIVFVFSSSVSSADTSKITALITSPLWMHIEGQNAVVMPFNSIKDGCWTNEMKTITSVELELKRNGFNILNKDAKLSGKYPLYISIKGQGYEIGESACVATYEVVVSYQDTQSISGTNGHRIIFKPYIRLWYNSGIMSGTKEGFGKRLKESYTSLIQEFIVMIDKKKARIIDEIDRDPSPENRTYWKVKFNLAD